MAGFVDEHELHVHRLIGIYIQHFHNTRCACVLQRTSSIPAALITRSGRLMIDIISVGSIFE